MNDYDLSKPLTLAQCQAMDLAALAEGRVGRGPDGSPFFLGYDDVVQLLVHPHASPGGAAVVERQGISDGPIHEWFRDFFALSDPPQHTHLRSLVARTFAVRPIERMRAVARKEAEEALDSLQPGRAFDVFDEFATRVPMRVICSVLGTEDLDLDALWKSICDLGRALVALSLSPEERVNGDRAIEELYAAIEPVVAKKRAQPGEDLISHLVRAEDAGQMTHGQLLAMVSGLMFAGIDTTRTLIALAFSLLAEHPDQRALLQRQPELAASAVEEIFRVAPPAPWIVRFAAQRMEHAGVVLEPGDAIMLVLSAANLDQVGIAEVERFDIARKPTLHLGLGRGRHFCLGAALARLEGQEMLQALAARGLRLELVGDVPRWSRADQLIRPSEPLRLRVHA